MHMTLVCQATPHVAFWFMQSRLALKVAPVQPSCPSGGRLFAKLQPLRSMFSNKALGLLSLTGCSFVGARPRTPHVTRGVRGNHRWGS